jgi:hypothetical protein
MWPVSGFPILDETDAMRMLLKLTYAALRLVWKFTYLTLLVLVVGVLALIGNEVYVYLSRSEAAAKSYAEDRFKHYCADDVLDPKTFSGPTLKRTDGKMGKAEQFHFTWVRKHDQEVVVSITYFPYDAEISGGPVK